MTIQFLSKVMFDHKTIFSEDRIYRFTLWRDWTNDSLELEEREGNNTGKFIMFIGLNPSTADETKDDPTIRRCIGFAKRWGYGALCMTNLFAFRATNPKDMIRHAEPVGIGNGSHLIEVAQSAGECVAAWGKHGRHNHRDSDVITLFEISGLASKLRCLGVNSDGTPKHPLYLRGDAKLEGFPQ